MEVRMKKYAQNDENMPKTGESTSNGYSDRSKSPSEAERSNQRKDQSKSHQ
jgi:hypothetical protein